LTGYQFRIVGAGQYKNTISVDDIFDSVEAHLQKGSVPCESQKLLGASLCAQGPETRSRPTGHYHDHQFFFHHHCGTLTRRQGSFISPRSSTAPKPAGNKTDWPA